MFSQKSDFAYPENSSFSGVESLESVSCGEDDDAAETLILGDAGTLRADATMGVTGVVVPDVSSPISGS